MEVDSEEGPLSLVRIRDTLDCAYVDGNECFRGIRDQHSEFFGIDIDLTHFKILWVIHLGAVSLNHVHLLDLLLSFFALNLLFVEADLQISLLQLVQAHLVALPVFDIVLFLKLIIGF